MNLDENHWIADSFTAQMSLDCIGGADSVKVSAVALPDGLERSKTSGGKIPVPSHLRGVPNQDLTLLPMCRQARGTN